MTAQYVHLAVASVKKSTANEQHDLCPVSTEEGIWCIRDQQMVVEYLFETAKGWTRKKAKDWMASHVLTANER